MVFGKVNCFNIHNIADQSFTFHQSRVPSLEDEMATDGKSQRRFEAKKMASVCNFMSKPVFGTEVVLLLQLGQNKRCARTGRKTNGNTLNLELLSSL